MEVVLGVFDELAYDIKAIFPGKKRVGVFEVLNVATERFSITRGDVGRIGADEVELRACALNGLEQGTQSKFYARFELVAVCILLC